MVVVDSQAYIRKEETPDGPWDAPGRGIRE